MHSNDESNIRVLTFQDNYPKVEYRGLAFLKDTSIIPNLIFAIQQVTIMQESLKKLWR
jgi:hypothetical protein